MINKILVKVLVLVFLIAGCGGVFKETIVPAENSALKFSAREDQLGIMGVKKVALFPFADYSHQQDFLQAEIWGGNIRILEEITDHFISHGVLVTVQEDVNTLLVDNDIIKPIANQSLIYGTGGDEKTKFRTKVIGTPEYDLVNVEHSEAMKEEIVKVIQDEIALEKAEKPSIQTSILQGATVGLSREMIKQLGEELGVDLIIRGRIIEYGFKEIDTYNPLERGFLPVLIEPVKDALFGVEEPRKYEADLEDVDYSRLGEGFGFLFGQKTEDDVEGTWDLTMEHSFGTLSNLYHRKKRLSSIVQIRMYAQDVNTGDVVWSNRVETEYSPKTNLSFDDKHPKTMFDRNIRRGVKLLMDDLFACISLQAEKKSEGREKEEFIIDEQDSVSELEEIRKAEPGLELTENDALIEELQNKIKDLENSKNILLQQIDGKTHITLPNAILFPSGTDTLNRQGIETLKTISKVLEKYPKHPICIEGYTDNVPIGPKIKDKYATNWELSAARAIRVMNYMAKNFKLDQSIMSVRGYGSFRPVFSNDTTQGKAKNRRVVIVIGS